jgi:hypothetical protein|tara:strand:- start:1278 stop:1559 length:282 start_codon:yes stop_codon:yes gene_type:complete
MEKSNKKCICCKNDILPNDRINVTCKKENLLIYLPVKGIVCYNCWLKLPLHMFEVSNVPLYIPKEQYKQYFKAKFKQYQFKRLSNGHVYRKVS